MKHFKLTHAPFIQIYQEFEIYTKAKSYKPCTYKMYNACVKEFIWYLEKRKKRNLKTLKNNDIAHFMYYLKHRKKLNGNGYLSERMICHFLTSIRTFFDYLLASHYCSKVPGKISKYYYVATKPRPILTLEEIQELYSTCISQTEKALLCLAYGCGLRRSEISKLNIKDVHFHLGSLVVREGKGGKCRTVPIAETMLDILSMYFHHERVKYNCLLEEAFLITAKGVRVSGNYANKMLLKVILRTNNTVLLDKKITLHSLRHSIATHLMNEGAPNEFIQTFLGHTLIDTVYVYTQHRKYQSSIIQQIY